MRDISSFGDALFALLRKKNCSAAELARRLGYKSHTSVVRILHQEVSHEVQKAFFNRLILTNALHLSADELASLRQCLETEAFPLAVRRAHEFLWDFLFAEQAQAALPVITLFTEDEEPRQLQGNQWVNTFTSAERIDMLIFGCCEESFFSLLSQAFFQFENKCWIRHYCDLGVSPDNAVKSMICAATMIRFKQYEAFYMQNETASNKLFTSQDGQMFLWWIDASGSTNMQVIYPSADLCFSIYKVSGGTQYRVLLDDLLKKNSNAYTAMRSEYVHPDIAENYLLLSQRLLFLEKNRSQRMYRPAPCYNHIATEILTPAILSMLQYPESHPAIQQLHAVHTERYVNAFSMRAPSKLIFLVSGMWDFIKTGFLPDHLNELPAIPVDGRLKVLHDLLDAATNNPFFQLYFFREDIRVHNLMLSSHGDLGVYLLDPVTTIQMQRGYFEEILTFSAFIDAFNSFFDTVLLKRSYTQQESRKKLCEMIHWLEENQANL